ncbi:MAG: polymerase III subunit delta'''' protein [Parcubacteria group bacterium GW2011_GWA1_40_21]|nr:MAG: polymerase III subunit delta'''' protein [Parcubacteria group bacterium GW2011_GWA1_40_21]
MNKVLDLKSVLPDSVEKLHHAYCLEGKREDILNELREFLENILKFKIKGNPDFYYGAFDTLGIDEGRSINEMQSRKAVSAPRRIFAIAANFITRETQNSLLKMFEEPAGGAVFFLIISSASILLPTLRSRMMVVNLNQGAGFGGDEKSEKSENIFDAKKFIESVAGERLAMVKKITDKIADEEISRSVAVDFLNDVEKEILNKSGSSEEKKKNLFIFEEIDKCRNYAGDRSPSVKMLLEHIALIV